MSGYVHCACRDCFEIAISGNDGEPALCSECEEAGCDCTGQSECAVEPELDEEDPALGRYPDGLLPCGHPMDVRDPQSPEGEDWCLACEEIDAHEDALERHRMRDRLEWDER